MSEISDELREWCDFYCDRPIYKGDFEKLRYLADRIDAEMVELPRDANGEPIRVGDTLFNGSKKYLVTCIFSDTEDCEFGFYANNNNNVAYNTQAFYHKSHDSLERIADELEEWSEDNRVNGDSEVFDRAADYAERIRRLTERED